MTDIAWRVAEVIANEYFRDPVATFDFHALDLNLQDEYHAMAKAAIRAIHRHLKSNVTKDMVLAARRVKHLSVPKREAEEVMFVAMLDEALDELEGK